MPQQVPEDPLPGEFLMGSGAFAAVFGVARRHQTRLPCGVMPEPVKAHSELLQKLRDRIRDRQVIVVVGSGVSIQATGNAEAASWKGLLTSGIRRCRQHDVTLGDRWEGRALEQLESPDSDEFLGVATRVARKLGNPPGVLADWIKDTVGALKATQPAVIEALHALQCPIWTTNYDDLLSTADLPPVTWLEKSKAHEVLRQRRPAIFHLHGHWDSPESIVLGEDAYARVRDEEHPKSMLKTAAAGKVLLFVGCGEGLSDPRFGPFREWLAAFNAHNPDPHYRLCRSEEQAQLQAVHEPGEPIQLVPYGTHNDLPRFLRDLAPTPAPVEVSGTKARKVPPGPKPPAVSPPTKAIEEYLRRLQDQVARLSLVGFGQSLRIDLPISEAYVPLRLLVSCTLKHEEIGRFEKERM
jgi:hypothetical protein